MLLKINLTSTLKKKENKMNYWIKTDIDYLKANFSNKSDLELSIILNRSEKGISNKANELNLRKSVLHISKQIGKRNKMVGRDLNIEYLTEVALKYKTRGEFQLADPSAYTTCRQLKIVDDVCKHMIKQHYSTPQLLLFEILKILFPNCIVEYNNRKAIKPYEIDIYIEEFNLGFEYNGKQWHTDNIKDKIKFDLCINNSL